MTLNDIISDAATKQGEASDTAYELYQGKRDIHLEINAGEDRATHPMIMFLDGVEIHLPIKAVEQMNAVSGFALTNMGAELPTKLVCPACQREMPAIDAQDKTHLCVDCQREEWDMQPTSEEAQ